MPVALPSRRAPERRLSVPDTVRLLVLVVRVRLIDRRLHAIVQQGSGFADDRLLRLMRRWLAYHEAIG